MEYKKQMFYELVPIVRDMYENPVGSYEDTVKKIDQLLANTGCEAIYNDKCLHVVQSVMCKRTGEVRSVAWTEDDLLSSKSAFCYNIERLKELIKGNAGLKPIRNARALIEHFCVQQGYDDRTISSIFGLFEFIDHLIGVGVVISSGTIEFDVVGQFRDVINLYYDCASRICFQRMRKGSEEIFPLMLTNQFTVSEQGDLHITKFRTYRKSGAAWIVDAEDIDILAVSSSNISDLKTLRIMFKAYKDEYKRKLKSREERGGVDMYIPNTREHEAVYTRENEIPVRSRQGEQERPSRVTAWKDETEPVTAPREVKQDNVVDFERAKRERRAEREPEPSYQRNDKYDIKHEPAYQRNDKYDIKHEPSYQRNDSYEVKREPSYQRNDKYEVEQESAYQRNDNYDPYYDDDDGDAPLLDAVLKGAPLMFGAGALALMFGIICSLR